MGRQRSFLAWLVGTAIIVFARLVTGARAL